MLSQGGEKEKIFFEKRNEKGAIIITSALLAQSYLYHFGKMKGEIT